MLEANLLAIPPPILQRVHGPQHDGQDDSDERGDDDSDLGGDEVRGVLGLEGLRADDVAETEAHEQDGVHGDFLRVAREVGRHPGVDDGQGGADAVGHVVADQLALAGVGGEEGHEAAADHAGCQEEDDEEAALVEVPGRPGAADHADDGDGAGGDGEERRLFGRVAESRI